MSQGRHDGADTGAGRRTMRRRVVAGLAGLACGAMVGTQAMAADIYGLVIGIDAYQPPVTQLRGAVSDALDIADGLRIFGARRVIVLINEAATRDGITAAWQDLLDTAAPGDTIVMSFAGHGYREPEMIPGDEQDQMDEVQLLAGFAPEGPGTRERLIDNETYAWFREAAERGIKVLFINDSCHSGTAVRAIDGLTYRLVEGITITDDQLSLDLAPEPDLGTEILDGVTYLGAGQDDQQIPELPIRDSSGSTRPRGALSYVFAEFLRQSAQGDTVELRRRDLSTGVIPSILSRADGMQTPSLLPLVGMDAVVLARGIAAVAPETEPSAPFDRDPSLGTGEDGLPILGIAVTDETPLPEALVGATAAPGVADLTWDAPCSRMASPIGDWSAGATAPTLQGFVDKWRLLYALYDRTGIDPIAIELEPSHGRHGLGTELTITIGPFGLPYLTMVQLRADGSATLAYPDPTYDDPLTVDPDTRLRFTFAVEPPLGEDHLVVVSASQPMTAVHQRFDGDRQARAADVAAALIQAIDGSTTRLGIVGLFTGDSPACGS